MLTDRVRGLRESSAGMFLADEGQLRRGLRVAIKPRALPTSPEVESSFWQSTPIEQLAADQGVPLVTDISELDGIWSEGDVFDDALSDLLRDRAERRRWSGRRSP